MSETDGRGDAPVCQLAGCTNVIDAVEQGAERRYCCVAHRKTARRRRKDQRAKPSVRLAHALEADQATTREPVDAPEDETVEEQDPPTPVAERSAPRVLVPQPRSRWLGRPVKPYAARGLGKSRARYPAEPLPSQPDWLRSSDPPPADHPTPADTARTFTRRVEQVLRTALRGNRLRSVVALAGVVAVIALVALAMA